jgi:predicted DNA-binding transcriptional regulator YafY
VRVTAARAASLFERRWRLAACLQGTRAGKSIASVLQELGVSRATLYRDLEFLRLVGVPLVSEVLNGEARYRVLGDARPGLVPALRRAALDAAYEALAPLKGTRLLAEIERLRRDLPELRRRGPIGVRRVKTQVPEDVLAAVERAVDLAQLLSIAYRGARDAAARERRVAPLELRLVKGQLYLAGHDLDADATRTFKLARVVRVTAGERFEKSAFPRPDTEGSVVVWTGRLLEVAVRLTRAVARFAGEYPLIEGQQLEAEADGGVVVRARVAGSEEVLRWGSAGVATRRC